jgi:single-strand selective monofunctional uracil DNA glycosylase
MKSLAGEPDNFFRNCFVYNFCPLLFLSSTGANVTPADLPVEKRNEIHALCDQALVEIIRLLNVKIVVGIGKYVYDGAVTLLESEALTNVSVQLLMHPSPANPAANKGWDAIAQKQLREAGVLQYIKRMN